MAEQPSHTTQPESPAPVPGNDPASDIVSVNAPAAHGPHAWMKVVIPVVVACVLVIGTIVWFKHWKETKRAEEAKQEVEDKRENRPAMVGQRRIFNSDEPALSQSSSRKPERAVVPETEPLPGDGQRPIPLADGGRRNGTNGQPSLSRYGGDVILTSNTMINGPKTQLDPVTPQGEALGLLRKVMARMDQEGEPTGHSASPSGDASSTSAGSGVGSGQPGTAVNYGAGRRNPLPGGSSTTGGSSQEGSLGGQLSPSSTPKARAMMLGDRNFILPKGRTIDCSLTVRIVSGLPGMATCVLNADVYSDNGRVLLLERGSEAVGEYSGTMVQGQQRIFVLWNRVKTPNGVTVELNSPGSDELGAAGLPGYVDRHWWERLGAAFMLSFVQDAIGFATASQAGGSGGQQLGIYQNSATMGNRMAERILESTINIKPTLYKNQGDRAMIFVARDLDFQDVYALRAD